MNSTRVLSRDTVPAQACYPATYFGIIGLNHQNYLQKSNVLDDKNDNHVGTSTLLFPDSRNTLSYNIQLLFFILFLPASSGFMLAAVAIAGSASPC